MKFFIIPAAIFVCTGFLDGGRMWNDTVLEAVRNSNASHLDLSRLGLGAFPLGELSTRRQSAHDILEKIKYLPPLKRQSAVEVIAEQSRELPSNLMLTSDRLRYLRREGVEIGAHTCTHPILSSLTPQDARREIDLGKKHLEDILQTDVRYFAYPNGRFGSDYELIHRDMVCDLGIQAAFSTHQGVSIKTTDRWQMPRFTPWDRSPQRFLIRLLLNQRIAVG